MEIEAIVLFFSKTYFPFFIVYIIRNTGMIK